jgi:hypothetical protein
VYPDGAVIGHAVDGNVVTLDLGTVMPSTWPGSVADLIYWVNPDSTFVGDSIDLAVDIGTSSPESNTGNNGEELRPEVTGSIDPNDKLATPVGKGEDHLVRAGEMLGYTILFENKPEATADAIFVRIVDTLDPNLDWSTLTMGAQSHPEDCEWSFDPGTGVITWACDSIMLPPNHNPPEGEGFVSYFIKPKDDLPEFTQILNEAWIRFDFNPWLHAPENEDAVVRTIWFGCCRQLTGNVSGDIADAVDISDLTYLVSYLFISGPTPDCLAEANVSGDPGCAVDVSDVTALVNYLFVTFEPPAPCDPSCE